MTTEENTVRFLVAVTLACMLNIPSRVLANTNTTTTVKHVLILNGAGIDSVSLERIREYAEANLYVPVIATNGAPVRGSDLRAIGEALRKVRNDSDTCLVALVTPDKETPLHAVMLTNAMVTVVNVEAMKTDDGVKYVRRLQRQVMRGSAFLFGIGPDPDPHCVMHDYRTLDDLDKMGLNFSPPWGEMFRKAAAARGMEVRPLSRPRPPKAPSAK